MLDLSKREFTKLPGEIDNFITEPEYFKTLTACNCKTQQLLSFMHFKKLQALDLSNNELGNFIKANTLSGLFLLKVLILKKNGITKINDQFFATAKNIEMLDLSENKISKCGKSFLDLPKLITLNLNKNQIDDLNAFKIFKTNPLLELQYLGIRQNNIESNYRSKFETTLTIFFPNLLFVLTIFSQQKELNAFHELLYIDHYLDSTEVPQFQNQIECSFHNDSLIANCIVSQNHTSAKKSKRSINSCDSRFGSFKKRDPETIKRQIEFRKKELDKLDSSIEQLNFKRDEIKNLTQNYQYFLQDSLLLTDNTLLLTVLKRLGEYCNSIDSLNQQKGRNLVVELLNSMKCKDSLDIDQTLMKMEAIMKKMQELMN
ncbi:unnamed protein product [Paramecium sonneborni]|uniref:Uncharacterized protein n=1 Tax=Paramecium sonneborni TaxID=65129 RepID=A0A8S1MSB1_9CILI|nr:unnamed protein product [Paramecium sonneborni]